MHPYNILALFFGLAYIALSLESTGLLKACAILVAKKGGSSTFKTFTYIYLLCLILSVLMGNDPVILSATSFLVHYSHATSMDLNPLLFAEFASSNIGSMVFFFGNPTNVVICEGFHFGYLTFTAYMIGPFIACSLVCFAVLWFQFKWMPVKPIESVPTEIQMEDVQQAVGSQEQFNQVEVEIVEESLVRVLSKVKRQSSASIKENALTDPFGAAVGTVMFLACVVVIIGASFVNVEVWLISIPFAILKALFDISWDLYRRYKNIPIVIQESRDSHPHKFFPTFHSKMQEVVPTFYQTCTRLPFPLISFLLSQFIIVQSLSFRNWISTFAYYMEFATVNLPTTAFVFGILTVILCAIAGTNILATILIAKTILAMNMDDKTITIASLVLAVGSNIGAVGFVFAASLAGLLWKGILVENKVSIANSDFAKYNMLPLIAMMLVGYLVVWAEVVIFN
ncbi:hypothetical protein HK103_002215 [Boothiomyces macroporosus]|uniref:Citrate transporter-like domain-containing protein n=1 Tax=Boothiomyces macroporosus TaxID=261099 RepID=A0AAD5Y4V8_9FUNG|nr:hypothetical protein HK103_002215 [Boothiomyces macroporosus]